MADKSYITITDFWGDNHFYADTVFESHNETASKILDHNGNPYKLSQPKMKIGFDTRLKKKE